MHIPLLSYYNTFTEYPKLEVEPGSWFIFHFSGPNKLNTIGCIEKNLNVIGVKHNIWIPCKKILVYKNNNLILMNEPIYYDYLFIRMSFNWDIFEKLKKDVKNLKVLSLGENPYELTKAEIGQMRDVHSTFNATVEETAVKNFKYKSGDYVRVAYGPFSDMTGQIFEVNNTQVVLNISFFGKEVRFFIPLDKSHFMIKPV